MIIQHRDGSYEICPLPPRSLRLLKAVLALLHWRRLYAAPPCLGTCGCDGMA